MPKQIEKSLRPLFLLDDINKINYTRDVAKLIFGAAGILLSLGLAFGADSTSYLSNNAKMIVYLFSLLILVIIILVCKLVIDRIFDKRIKKRMDENLEKMKKANQLLGFEQRHAKRGPHIERE